MSISLTKFLAYSAQTLIVMDYGAHVAAIKAKRPNELKRINKVDLITRDYVLHYEKAILLGTTEEYAETSQIWHFDQILEGSDKYCTEIDLAGCVKDLICENRIPHNLDKKRLGCD